MLKVILGLSQEVVNDIGQYRGKRLKGLACNRCFQVLQQQVQKLFVFKLQVFGSSVQAVNECFDQLFARTNQASIAVLGMTQVQCLDGNPGPLGFPRYQPGQIKPQFGFAFDHQRRKWQVSCISAMTALMETLATGDDVGKVQGSIRREILGLKMFVMGAINRDRLTAIRA